MKRHRVRIPSSPHREVCWSQLSTLLGTPQIPGPPGGSLTLHCLKMQPWYLRKLGINRKDLGTKRCEHKCSTAGSGLSVPTPATCWLAQGGLLLREGGAPVNKGSPTTSPFSSNAPCVRQPSIAGAGRATLRPDPVTSLSPKDAQLGTKQRHWMGCLPVERVGVWAAAVALDVEGGVIRHGTVSMTWRLAERVRVCGLVGSAGMCGSCCFWLSHRVPAWFSPIILLLQRTWKRPS